MTARFKHILPLAAAALAGAVGAAPEGAGKPADRPQTSDANALQVIRNYLKVSGGEPAHRALEGVRASGMMKERRHDTRVEFHELRDGRYFERRTWRFLGREYEEIHACDGKVSWSQQVRPEIKPAVKVNAPRRARFLFPFLDPDTSGHVFEFAGEARAYDRPAYLVIGHAPDGLRTWYYFDRETFLVVRHGGSFTIGGEKSTLDSGTVRFKPVAGVQLPAAEVELIEGQPTTELVFDAVEANPEIDPEMFAMPEFGGVWLRQESDRK